MCAPARVPRPRRQGLNRCQRSRSPFELMSRLSLRAAVRNAGFRQSLSPWSRRRERLGGFFDRKGETAARRCAEPRVECSSRVRAASTASAPSTCAACRRAVVEQLSARRRRASRRHACRRSRPRPVAWPALPRRSARDRRRHARVAALDLRTSAVVTACRCAPCGRAAMRENPYRDRSGRSDSIAARSPPRAATRRRYRQERTSGELSAVVGVASGPA